jgi:type IV secretion system protein VirB2
VQLDAGLDGAASQVGALPGAAHWLEALLTGPLSTTISIVVIAVLGFRLLAGDLPIRSAARAVLGCFILFGAPIVASGLYSAADGLASDTAIDLVPTNATVAPLPTLVMPKVPSASSGNPFDPVATRP